MTLHESDEIVFETDETLILKRSNLVFPQYQQTKDIGMWLNQLLESRRQTKAAADAVQAIPKPRTRRI